MKEKRIQQIAMFLLAIFPVIIFFYVKPFVFGYGMVLFMLFFLYLLINGRMKTRFSLPKPFIFFWMYVGFATLVFSKSFSPTFLLPGGTHVFSWAICFGFCSGCFNLDYLRKYMRGVFIVSSVLFCIQEVQYLVLDSKMCFVPMLSSDLLYRDMTYAELVARHMIGERSSSIFMEPSYFAQYLLCLLAIELGCEESRDRMFNKYSICIATILLVLRSGCGIIGLVVILSIKIMSLFHAFKGFKKLAFLLCVISIFIFGLQSYSNSEIGTQLLDRQSEFSFDNTESSGFIRMLGGFVVYDKLPFINKIFGSEASEGKQIATQTFGYEDGMLYNGFQAILTSFGLLGMILLIIVLVSIYRKGNTISKYSIIMLVIISFIEYIYFSPIMLILMVIAYSSLVKNKLMYINSPSI